MNRFLPALLAGAVMSLAAPVTAATLNVRDFGARGDGRTDDSRALIAAVAALKKAEPGSVLTLPAGTYLVQPDPESKRKPEANLELVGLENRTISGEGDVTLLFGRWVAGVFIYQCRDLTVRNLKLDHRIPPFTQGKLLRFVKEANAIDVAVDPGYPSPDGDFLTPSNWCKFYLADGTLRNDLLIAWCKKIERLSDGSFRFIFKDANYRQGKLLQPGLRVSLMTRRPGNAVKVMNSVGLKLEDVRVYSSPECGFSLYQCDAVSMTRCAVERKPGTNRLLSSNADALHVKFNRRGPRIEYCRFADCDDDCINIAGNYQRVWSQPAADTILIDWDNNGAAGDEYVFFRYDDAVSLGRARSVAQQDVKINGVKKRQLKLDRPLKLEPVASAIGEPLNWRLTLQTRLKLRSPGAKPVMVCNLDATGRNAVIRHNYFGQHFPRGILIHGVGAVIEDNVFENFTGPAVVAGNDFSWGEGPDAAGLLVRNNVFRNISRSAVMVAEHGLYRPTAASTTIADITVTGNRFENYGRQVSLYGRGVPGNALYLDNVRNAVVADNTFVPVAGEPVAPDVIVKTCADVIFRHNVIFGHTPAQWLKNEGKPGAVKLEQNRFNPANASTAK